MKKGMALAVVLGVWESWVMMCGFGSWILILSFSNSLVGYESCDINMFSGFFFLNSVVGITKFRYVIDGKDDIDQGYLKSGLN